MRRESGLPGLQSRERKASPGDRIQLTYVDQLENFGDQEETSIDSPHKPRDEMAGAMSLFAPAVCEGLKLGENFIHHLSITQVDVRQKRADESMLIQIHATKHWDGEVITWDLKTPWLAVANFRETDVKKALKGLQVELEAFLAGNRKQVELELGDQDDV